MVLRPRAMPTFQFQRLNPAFQSDPRRILGQQLMGQGASTAPVRTPLQGLGRLSSALVGAYLQRNALDAQAEREAQATEALQAALPQNLTPGVAALFAANPAAGEQALMSAAIQPTTQSRIVDQNGLKAIETTTTNPVTQRQTTTLSNLVQPRAAAKLDVLNFVNPNDPNDVRSILSTDPNVQSKAQNLVAQGFVERQGGTNVTVNPEVNIENKGKEAFETELQKLLAKGQYEALTELTKQANLASENEQQIDAILDLYNRTEAEGFDPNELTGPGTEFKFELTQTLASIGGLFGFDYKELGIDVDKITNQQTLQAAFNKLSLEMTKLLRGAISEKELTVASRATANFGNTPEANRIILLTQKAAAIKARAVEDEAFRYLSANKQLGEGTMDGKKYNSFNSYKREFIKRDEEFVIKQVIPEINSVSEMKALVKIAGGLNNLSDETVQLMDQKLGTLQ